MQDNPKIKAFFFDIGGVLVSVDSSRSVQRLSKKLDVPADKIQSAMTRELLEEYEKGRLSSNQFYEQLLINCNSAETIDLSSFRAYWQEVLFPMEESLDFLKRVKQDFPVWLLSNTNDFHYDILMQDFPFMKWVDGGTYSFLLGSMKPEPEIYIHAIMQCGFRPEEILFIDDLEVNVQGAREQGINVIQFKKFESFTHELKIRFPELGYLV